MPRMKMNLAVVMQTIDKASAPLKKIKGEYGQFTPKIEAAQKALKDKSAILTNIQALQKLQAQRKTNSDAINVSTEKLAKYQAQIKAGKPLNANQQAQYNKTKVKLDELKLAQSEYKNKLSKTGSALKKAGVDTKNLTAAEKRLNSEHDKAVSKLNSMQSRYKKIEAIKAKLAKPFSMGGIKAGAIGLAGSAFGFFASINSHASKLDALGKKAQNLDLPVEQFQALRSQAEHAGLSTDDLDGSMFRLTKRLGVLQTTGSGALGSFLKKGKNPLYQQLKTVKNTDEAYQKILESFSKLKTNQERMAFADAAFGDSGRRMLIMLREGTQGLTNARKELNDLGGGANNKDVATAADYNDALQKIGEAIDSIKIKALTPIIRQLTKSFNLFIEKFKNAKWREETIVQVTNALQGFFSVLKSVGRGFLFLKDNFPEVIAGILMLKAVFFMLNAVMYANPIGMIIGGLAMLAIGFTYAYQKSETFRNILSVVFEWFQRIGVGIFGVVGKVIQAATVIPRTIMKMLSMIPDSILPEGWGQSIKNANKDLEDFNNKFKGFNKDAIKYAINGTMESSNITQNSSILKNPTVQSKSTVDVNIKSDKPVEVASVASDRNTDLNINNGDILSEGI